MAYKQQPIQNFTLKELSLISKVLNTLLLSSDHTYGVKMDSFHIGRFNSKKHYIDFNEKHGKCKVYKKYKNWQPSEEKLKTTKIWKT